MVRVASFLRFLVLCGLALSALAFAKTNNNKTVVTYPSSYAVSPRISDLPIDLSLFGNQEMPEPGPSPLKSHAVFTPMQSDPALQKEVLPELGATKGIDFEGIGAQNFAPSDSNLAVGPNHIVETVNVRLAIYNKSGTLLSGPTNITSFFAALGGNCAAGASDPIVLYDRLADRWLISDVGIGNSFSECVGVSTTNDPTGSYTLYSYGFNGNLNDYPKLGVWPTTSNAAYLATYNIFTGSGFAGADICGLDRTKMLSGDKSAAQLCQMTGNTEGSYLPSDNDGDTAPTDGTPGLYITWQNNNPGQLYLRTLTLNFASSTATLSSPTTINVANDNLACGNAGTCVPQEGTTQTLDTLGDRMMYRFPVRHFPDHDRAVLNHAVDNGGPVAIRWYELYDPAGSVTLNQQGTFAPDSTYRWMASAAEDKQADIGIGFSASSSSIHPAIRVSGRVPSDPAGTLESELSIIEGTGSQNGGLSRWGDYTAMQVDPSDDCTFWYVDQYEKVSGSFNWNTHIGSFAFNGCSGAPDFNLSANPSAVSIAQGNTGTSTITVTPLNGFTGSVTLSASGLPTGTTAAFNPNPTASTSTLTFTVASNANVGTFTVTITGTSGALTHQTAIQLTVTVNGALVSLSPTSLSFPKTAVGTTSAPRTVTLTNTGTGPLSISSISASGDFGVLKTTCGSTVQAGKKCTVSVTFSPTAGGTRTGTLSFSDNAPGSPQTVSLSGIGTALKLTPKSLAFGGVTVGQTSSPQSITISNGTSSTVTFTSIKLGGTFPGDYQITNNTCGGTLGGNSNCVVTIVFKPTNRGDRSANLTVKSNGGGSPQTAALTGTGE